MKTQKGYSSKAELEVCQTLSLFDGTCSWIRWDLISLPVHGLSMFGVRRTVFVTVADKSSEGVLGSGTECQFEFNSCRRGVKYRQAAKG